MAAIIDYSSSRFNAAPDIHSAVTKCTKLQASTLISDVLGPLIVAVGMERSIALPLYTLTSLFPMTENLSLTNQSPPPGGAGITPYEFTYSKKQPLAGAQLTLDVKGFLRMFGGVLVEYGLVDIIGVRLLGGAHNHLDQAELPDVEITTGQASITLPGLLFQYRLEVEDTFVETDWVFQKTGEAQGGLPVVCRKCKTTCKIRAGEHRNFHQGTNL
ncbi:hypothetical protein EV426DRAFT_679922 [Tirmania nivea]|nr:hypothetical protein EV426DRAFT_679922 [Tirmania nivea]